MNYPGRGAGVSSTLQAFAPLNGHEDPGIMSFYGIAHYRKHFSLPSVYNEGHPLVLDLGRAGDLAEVRVNWQMVGAPRHAPFRVNVGFAVRHKDNKIESRVANLWVNGLIEDAQPEATRTMFPSCLPTS